MGAVTDGSGFGRQLQRALVPFDDRRLNKQLARTAREQAKIRQRLETNHGKAVRRREWDRRRARTELPGQAVVALGTGLASLPLDGMLGTVALVVAAVAAIRSVLSVQALRRPPIPPLSLPPLAPTAAPPPPVSSAAFPAVRRLEVVRAELTRLLPLVSPAGQQVAAETWAAAGEADAALRWQAARFAAVESHRGADRELMGPLYAGVQRQEAVVVAVADLIAASADPLGRSRLQDATDALYGLAQGLREVQGRPA